MIATSCGLPMDFAEIFTLSVNARPALACAAMSATACCTTQESIDRMLPNRSATYRNAARREQVAVVGAQPEQQLVLAHLVGREVEDGLTEQLELIVRERALNALGLRQPRRQLVAARPARGR